jgi:hypothetical protein
MKMGLNSQLVALITSKGFCLFNFKSDHIEFRQCLDIDMRGLLLQTLDNHSQT